MATCGNCKQQGMSVEHIKACYANKGGVATMVKAPEVAAVAVAYVEAKSFKPMALVIDVPDSRYALMREDGPVFYEVNTGTKGKWTGFLFLSHLVGAPGDFQKYPVMGEAKKAIIAEIGLDPKAAAVRFSKEFTICAVCGSPLSDPVSLASGLGPVCAKRF